MMEGKCFVFTALIGKTMWSKSHETLWVGAPHGKGPRLFLIFLTKVDEYSPY